MTIDKKLSLLLGCGYSMLAVHGISLLVMLVGLLGIYAGHAFGFKFAMTIEQSGFFGLLSITAYAIAKSIHRVAEALVNSQD